MARFVDVVNSPIGGELKIHYLDFRVMRTRARGQRCCVCSVAFRVRIIRALGRRGRECPRLLDLDQSGTDDGALGPARRPLLADRSSAGAALGAGARSGAQAAEPI
jgi:hypothetical protein